MCFQKDPSTHVHNTSHTLDRTSEFHIHLLGHPIVQGHHHVRSARSAGTGEGVIPLCRKLCVYASTCVIKKKVGHGHTCSPPLGTGRLTWTHAHTQPRAHLEIPHLDVCPVLQQRQGVLNGALLRKVHQRGRPCGYVCLSPCMCQIYDINSGWVMYTCVADVYGVWDIYNTI